MIRSLLVCLITISLPASGIAAAQGTGANPAPLKLSLADAELRAREASHSLRQAGARLEAASARSRSAGALPNPTLSVGQPFGHDTGGLDEDILITQTYELGDKRRQRVRAAKAEVDAASSDRADSATNVQLSTETAYFDALRSDVERKLAQESLENARAFARTAETQFQAGDVARSNVVRSGLEVTRAEQTLDSADTDRENRYAALKSLIGLPPDAEVELTDSLAFSSQEFSLAKLREMSRRRPDLAAARRLRDAREASLHGARVQGLPDLFVEGRHSTIDPTVGGSSIRVGVTLPLVDFGRNRADVQAARAALNEQSAALAELERTAALEVDTAYRNLVQTQRTVRTFQSGRLGRSKELLDMAQIGYQRGASNYLELLDAQQVYRTEQAEYARALAAFNVALATLRHAVGGQLP